MNGEFENWTMYDDWLVEHYDKYAVTDVAEKGGKIAVVYEDRAEWLKKGAKSDKEQ